VTLTTPEECTFTASLDCHYLLQLPEVVGDRTLLVVTLHGYGSNPEVMMRLTRAMLGPNHVIASLQAPSQFFLGAGNPNSEVGYCWATHKHSASSIRLHHEMLLHVFNEAGRRCQIPVSRRLLVGFSQPVGLNYRFSATSPGAVRGVIGICGGVPKNWDDGDYKPVEAALLHIARREDEFYPPSVTEQYAERLRRRAQDVAFHLLDGGHRFPSKAGAIVEPWIERVFLLP
jgi:predicted esterase